MLSYQCAVGYECRNIFFCKVDRLEFQDSEGGTVFAMCVCVCVVMCGGGTVFAMRLV